MVETVQVYLLNDHIYIWCNQRLLSYTNLSKIYIKLRLNKNSNNDVIAKKKFLSEYISPPTNELHTNSASLVYNTFIC
jgi:hypothetical protein